MTSAPAGPNSTEPVRAVFRAALRDVVVVILVLTVIATVAGGCAVGGHGVWGAVLGGAIALIAAATTPAVMLLTAGAPLGTASAAAMAAWVVKAGVLLVAFLALGETDLVDRRVLAIVVVLGVLVSLAADCRAVARGRVPYVDPDAASPRSPHPVPGAAASLPRQAGE